MNAIRILILHRYNLKHASETNPAIHPFLTAMSAKHDVHYLSFLGDSEVYDSEIQHCAFHKVPIKINRKFAFAKLALSFFWVLFAPIYCKAISLKFRFDLIYCDDSFPLYPLLVKLLHPRTKVIMRLGDLQTGYVLDGSNFASAWAFRIVHFFEKIAWKHVGPIIPISESFSAYIKDATNKSYPVVEECVSTKDMASDEFIDVRKIYSIPDDKFLYLFHGSIEKTKGIETLLRAIELANKKTSQNHYLIVGDGTFLPRVKKLAHEKKLANVTFTGWINFDLIPSIVQQTDAGIVMRKNTLANQFILTSALLQYLYFNQTILAPDLNEIRKTADQLSSIHLYDPDNVSDFASKLLAVSGAAPSKTQTKNFVLDRYDSDVIAKRLQVAVISAQRVDQIGSSK